MLAETPRKTASPGKDFGSAEAAVWKGSKMAKLAGLRKFVCAGPVVKGRKNNSCIADTGAGAQLVQEKPELELSLWGPYPNLHSSRSTRALAFFGIVGHALARSSERLWLG